MTPGTRKYLEAMPFRDLASLNLTWTWNVQQPMVKWQGAHVSILIAIGEHLQDSFLLDSDSTVRYRLGLHHFRARHGLYEGFDRECCWRDLTTFEDVLDVPSFSFKSWIVRCVVCDSPSAFFTSNCSFRTLGIRIGLGLVWLKAGVF